MAILVNRKVRTFKDLNLVFGLHPVTADVNRHYDEDAIKNAIKNLILTKNYERPFHPEIGTQAAALLFENFTPITAELIKKSIETTITTFEPRAKIIDIRVAQTDDANELAITVEFKPINAENPIVVTTFLTRVR
jgi:phage baseplate assembly protein W